MPEPHGFAVRFSAGHPARRARSRITALRTRFAPDAACVHRIPSRVRDDAIRPSCRDGTAQKEPLIWGRCQAEYFCVGDCMTQISLILFNKLPFVCKDTGNLSEGGRARETKARVQVVVRQARCIYVRISDVLSKAEPIALAPPPPASLQFFLADHDRVAGVRCQN